MLTFELSVFQLLPRVMQRILGSPRLPTRLAGSNESFIPTDSRLRQSSTFEHLSFSPFDRLPLELHAEIFSHCLDPFPHLDANDGPPTVIARVCGAWRALVMSTPKLWASFEIEVQDAGAGDAPEHQHSIRLLQSVRIWLERSRNHPLSVRLIHIPTGPIPSQTSLQLLAILVSQARRWRHIEFMLPSTSLSAAQGLLPQDFPTLKQLKIHMKGQWNYGHGVPLSNPLETIKISWAQLTKVDLRLDHSHLLNLDEYLDFLSDACSLVSCSINASCTLSIETSTSSPSGTRRKLHLPALDRLHLVLQGGSQRLDAQQQQQQHPAHPFHLPGESLVSFLGLFSECNLTCLELDWLIDSAGSTTRWEASSYSSFRSLLFALSPSLHSLRLAYLPLGEEELYQSLAPLSNLATLDLRFSLADHEQDPITDRFLGSLVVVEGESGGASACAEALGVQLQFAGLEQIHIQCSGERCGQGTLLELIRSRTRGASFKQFHFYSMSPVLDDVAQYIEEWSRQQVDVKLESVVLL